MSASASDESLLERFRQGERAALARLIERHSRALFNFALRFLGNPSDAEDMVQESFLAVFEKHNQFDPRRGRFRNWLFRIAANRSLNLLECRRRRRTLLSRETWSVWPADAGLGGAGEEVLDLRAALEDLSEKERQMILLSYYHGFSYREIAEILAIPLGTVKSRMYRAVARLRDRLNRAARSS